MGASHTAQGARSAPGLGLSLGTRSGRAWGLQGGLFPLPPAVAARLLVLAGMRVSQFSGVKALTTSETPLHQAADRHVPALSVAFRYAFAKGRARLKATKDADKAAAAVQTALKGTLEPTLLKVLAAGGDVGAGVVLRAAEGDDLRSAKASANPKLRFRFNVQSPQVIAWAKKHAATLVTQITDTTRERIRAAVEGIVTDGDWDDAWDRIAAAVGDEDRAELIARHECLPGETLVDTAVVRAVHRRWYEGDVAEVCTGSGHNFTATPNHPMLTNRGWVAAGDLQESDYLVCDIREQRSSSPGDHDVQRPPTTISQLFDAAAMAGVVERHTTINQDFHGDGQDGEVDIAYPFRSLVVGLFTPLYEPLVKLFLTEPDKARAAFCDSCGRLLPINEAVCLCHSAKGNPRVEKDSLDDVPVYVEETHQVTDGLFGQVARNYVGCGQVISSVPDTSALLKRQVTGLGSGTDNTGLTQNVLNPGLVSGQGSGHLPTGHSGQIELDRIISIRLRSFRGHVYNLSTPFGYFTLKSSKSKGGIYTGNTMTAASEGQRQAWDQAIEKGLLTGDEQRVWIVTPDDKLCPICEGLEDKKADLGGTYTGDDGNEYGGPPAHVACRCTEGLT